MSPDQSTTNTSSLLKREAVKEAITDRISVGELQAGERLPSIRAIADEHGVSIAPVRQALGELTKRGVIESLPGRRGLFVRPQRQDHVNGETKIDAIAVAYEGAKYWPQHPGKLASQLLVEVLAEEAAPRHLMLRPIPHKPVPAEGQDDELLQILARHRVVVFIHPVYLHWTKYLESLGCRVLFLLTDFFCPGVNYLTWNNYTAQRRIVEHLIQHGHRRIAYIGRQAGGDPNSNKNGKMPDKYMKYAGYHDALLDHRIPVNPQWTPSCFIMDGYRETRRMLEQLGPHELPTAIAASNDIRAWGVVEALDEAGLKVPEDISVVGMDDRYEASACDPPLTTIGPDRLAVAQTVLDFAEAEMENRELPPINREMPHCLIERQSVAPPKP